MKGKNLKKPKKKLPNPLMNEEKEKAKEAYNNKKAKK